MSRGHRSLHVEIISVVWAQAPGMSEALNGQVRLAKRDFHPTAQGPRYCQIRVEPQRSVDQGVALCNFIDNISKREPCCAERKRIIIPHLYCLPCQQSCFGDVLIADGRPVGSSAPYITKRCRAVSSGEIWIEFNSTAEVR